MGMRIKDYKQNRKKSVLKLNDKGSTLVLALIAITLVSLLAVAIIGAALNNLAMKGVDRDSKKSFYTAESVLEEIRAGVGLDSMNALGKAYETVLTNLISDDGTGSHIIDNDEANENFKKEFVTAMVKKVSSDTVSFDGATTVLNSTETVKNAVKTYLQGFLSGYDIGAASVKSVGGIEAYLDRDSGLTYAIIIKDVSVEYRGKKGSDSYFADVTADLDVEFPNMIVDFSNTNRVNGFRDFAIVANKDLNIKASTVSVDNSIYGGNSINITADNMKPAKLLVGNMAQKPDLVSAGDIKVNPTADNIASLSTTFCNIWCENLTANGYIKGKDDASKGAEINLDDNTTTYVKDDLNLNGANATVNIGGKYYGYSFDGKDSSDKHANSSAIIINGKSSKLTLSPTEMVIGGHAYIDLNESGYMTGEAVGIKGNQEVYLIPSEYIGKNYTAVANPMPEQVWDGLMEKVEKDAADSTIPEEKKTRVVDMSGFFAYENGYLAGTPYTAIKNNNLVYLYLKFNTKEDAAKYIRDVANGANGADKKLTEKLNKYTKKLFSDGGFVKINSDAAGIFSKGAIVETAGSSQSTQIGSDMPDGGSFTFASSTGDMSNDNFVLTSMDLKNRFTILSHLLVNMPWQDNAGRKYIVNDVESALWQQQNYIVTGAELNSIKVFDSIIDRSWFLGGNEYNPEGKYIQYGESGYNYIKMAINGNYTVPDDCTGGIIVATGNINLGHDFNGLLLAGGDINITGDAKITTNSAMIEYLITTEPAFIETATTPVPFRSYFYAYKSSAVDTSESEQIKIETIDYKDIVKFNNWRKYAD